MTEKSIIRSEHRAKLIDLLGGCCVKCGTVDKLQFDHIAGDRRDKKHLISQMLTADWDEVLSEVRKCQLLCIRCHTAKSVLERGNKPAQHGTIGMYANKGCRCLSCRAAWATYYKKYKKTRR